MDLPKFFYLRTQNRNDSLLTPSSFATRLIAPFAVSDMNNELDGTSFQFRGVFHRHEKISSFPSPCLYYPRGMTPIGDPDGNSHNTRLNTATMAQRYSNWRHQTSIGGGKKCKILG